MRLSSKMYSFLELNLILFQELVQFFDYNNYYIEGFMTGEKGIFIHLYEHRKVSSVVSTRQLVPKLLFLFG